MNGRNTVTDTFDGEKFNGFSDFFRTADFAGVHEATEARGSRGFIDRQKITGGDAEFVAADAERDNFRRGAAFCGVDDAHGGFGAELADGIEYPAQREAAGLELFGGTKNGSEIGFGRLFAEEHDADGERDFSVDDVVLQELFAKIVGNERVVGGFTQIAGDPFESVEETEKVGVIITAADFGFGGGDTVASGKGADGGGLNGTFEVEVKFGLR